jgi:hypothetical protein
MTQKNHHIYYIDNETQINEYTKKYQFTVLKVKLIDKDDIYIDDINDKLNEKLAYVTLNLSEHKNSNIFPILILYENNKPILLLKNLNESNKYKLDDFMKKALNKIIYINNNIDELYFYLSTYNFLIIKINEDNKKQSKFDRLYTEMADMNSNPNLVYITLNDINDKMKNILDISDTIPIFILYDKMSGNHVINDTYDLKDVTNLFYKVTFNAIKDRDSINSNENDNIEKIIDEKDSKKEINELFITLSKILVNYLYNKFKNDILININTITLNDDFFDKIVDLLKSIIELNNSSIMKYYTTNISLYYYYIDIIKDILYYINTILYREAIKTNKYYYLSQNIQFYIKFEILSNLNIETILKNEEDYIDINDNIDVDIDDKINDEEKMKSYIANYNIKCYYSTQDDINEIIDANKDDILKKIEIITKISNSNTIYEYNNDKKNSYQYTYTETDFDSFLTYIFKYLDTFIKESLIKAKYLNSLDITLDNIDMFINNFKTIFSNYDNDISLYKAAIASYKIIIQKIIALLYYNKKFKYIFKFYEFINLIGIFITYKNDDSISTIRYKNILNFYDEIYFKKQQIDLYLFDLYSNILQHKILKTNYIKNTQGQNNDNHHILINYITSNDINKYNENIKLIDKFFKTLNSFSTTKGGQNKYIKTDNKITFLYNKKKYSRIIYINERKKYVKINKDFILLSKVKKI